jgi:GWxTD domain-containing protein
MLLGLVWPAAAPADKLTALGPPPWRVGGRVGFTADVAAFSDSTGAMQLEVYARIPPATLTQLERDSTRAGRLRLTVRLKNAYGARTYEQPAEFALSSVDTSGGFGKVLVVQIQTRPGPQRLAIRLEDVLSRKRGLFYAGRDVNEASTIEGGYEVPAPRATGSISDVEFVWAEGAPGRGSALQRGGLTVIPNPERLYGLFAGDLRMRFAAATPNPAPWRWQTRVLDRDGLEVARTDTTGPAGARLDGALRLDVSALPAGGYDLAVEATPDGGAPLRRRSHFTVAWEPDSWLRNARDVEDDVHFLLSADDEEAFVAMGPGEQERFLLDFWKERDPTPGTALNEARSTYLTRVAHANQTWTRAGLVKGMFSDMGRTYIRYGEPAEVVHEVIPTGDETLDRVLAELRSTEDRPIGDVDAKGPGGDQRPFELWIYQGEIALPPDADPKVASRTRHRRLVFLFVDEHGFGDYRLRYSTE